MIADPSWDAVQLAPPATGRFARLAPWRPVIVAVLTVMLLALVSVSVVKMAQEVRYDEILAALRATSWGAVASAVLLTALSFGALSIYDVSALKYVGRRVPYRVVAFTSFCAYAVGNTAGFGPLTGGAVRYRFYAPLGVEPEELARIIMFVTAAFGAGLALVTAIGLLIAADDVAAAIGVPPTLLRTLAIGVLVVFGVLIGAAVRQGVVRIRSFSMAVPRLSILLGQFAATAIDISASASVLWVLLPSGALSLPGFIAVFAVAVGLGVLSHVPGGLGVFEAVIISVVGRTVPLDQVLGALVLYRGIYYLLPLLVAAALVSVAEIRRAVAGPAAARLARAGAQLAPVVIATLTLVLGAIMVFSSVTPTPDDGLGVLAGWFPLPVVESSHFLASILGIAMVVIARGLAFRLDGAWWMAVLVTIAAILLSIFKALALGEAILLAVLLFALLATRASFQRPASLIHQSLSLPWIVAIATIVAAALVILVINYRDVEYSHDLWWQFEISDEAPRSLRAILAITLLAGSLALWNLLRPAAARARRPDPIDMARAVAIVEEQSAVDANLVRTGDKSLMFSDDGRAFIMYGIQGRSWVALFDPVGPRDAWAGLIWRFVEAARLSGGRAVFYQVAPENLALYADTGLRAFKLGEEACVDLPGFTLTGASRAGLRQTLSRGKRDGLVFEILDEAGILRDFDRLKAVSDAWLAHKAREKSFSLGSFQRDYLLAQPVAVLRRDGVIVAFATLLMTRLTEEASIDLMRFDAGAPKVSMEFLLINLIEHLKARGFRSFNLGMSPLSGLSRSSAAPIWDRIGRIVFEHGERYYNFQGLRAFKAKFQPEWHARYLAVSGGINPALAFADITVLIGGGLKGVVGK